MIFKAFQTNQKPPTSIAVNSKGELQLQELFELFSFGNDQVPVVQKKSCLKSEKITKTSINVLFNVKML